MKAKGKVSHAIIYTVTARKVLHYSCFLLECLSLKKKTEKRSKIISAEALFAFILLVKGHISLYFPVQTYSFHLSRLHEIKKE